MSKNTHSHSANELPIGNRRNDRAPPQLDQPSASSNRDAIASQGLAKELSNFIKVIHSNLIRCEICSCEMSSEVVLESHVNGSRHKKKLKAKEILANLKASGGKGISIGPENNPHSFLCELCYVIVNSPQQLEIHLAGARHQNKITKQKLTETTVKTGEKRAHAAAASKGDGPETKKKKEDKSMVCDVCNVVVNSEIQYEQHIYSKKHLKKTKMDPKVVVQNNAAEENRRQPRENLTAGQRSTGANEQDKNASRTKGSGGKNQANAKTGGQSPKKRSGKSPRKNKGGSGGNNNSNSNSSRDDQKPPSRHFMGNNSDCGANSRGVGLHELGQFFSKPRSHLFDAKGAAMPPSSKS